MCLSKLFLDVSLPFPSFPSLLLPSSLLLFVYNVCLLNYSNYIMYSAQVLFQLFGVNLNTQLFYFIFVSGCYRKMYGEQYQISS